MRRPFSSLFTVVLSCCIVMVLIAVCCYPLENCVTLVNAIVFDEEMSNCGDNDIAYKFNDTNIPDITIGALTNFADDVETVGDINGDSVLDFVVGQSNSDKIYICLLHPTISGEIQSVVALAEPVASGSNKYGRSIAALGDIDSDNVPDIAVGAPYWGAQRGKIYIEFLNSDGTRKSYVLLEHNVACTTGSIAPMSNNYYMGTDVTSIGDMDADGVADIHVTGDYGGRTWMIYLNADGTCKKSSAYYASGKTGHTSDSIYHDEKFGKSCNPAGDQNNDGVTDMVFGGNRYAFLIYLLADTEDNGGVVYDYAMKSVPLYFPDLDPYYGGDVQFVDDFDNNGYQDMVVTGSGYNYSGNENLWSILIVFLTANFVQLGQRIITGNNADVPMGGLPFPAQIGAYSGPNFSIYPNFSNDSEKNHTYMLIGLMVWDTVLAVPLWPCNCSGTAFVGRGCENSCENGGLALSYYDSGDIHQCDCVGQPAYGQLCQNACFHNATAVPESGYSYCNCTGLNNVGLDCKKSCNNGYVEDPGGWTTCNCTNSGATGTYCHRDVDDCASDPCLNSGICTDLGDDLLPNHAHEYNCTCIDNGWTGYSCDIDIDDCLTHSCLHNSTCIDELNGYQCNCTGTGYEGDFCDINIDDCTSDPCMNGGLCNDGINNFTCDCPSHRVGKQCQDHSAKCVSSPCANDGLCIEQGSKFTCDCSGTQMRGELCSIPCFNGGTASENVEMCNCTGTRHFGTNCSIPCLNNGVENKDFDGCNCDGTGYTGLYCETYINVACDDNPCFPDGSCDIVGQYNSTAFTCNACTEDNAAKCSNGSSCVNLNTTYECDCEGTPASRLYTGQHCDICQCENGGRCIYSENLGPRCSCTGDNGGVLCENLHVCTTNPCGDGGECVILESNNNNDFRCSCNEEITGLRGANCSISVCDTTDPNEYGYCAGDLNECVPGYLPEGSERCMRLQYCEEPDSVVEISYGSIFIIWLCVWFAVEQMPFAKIKMANIRATNKQNGTPNKTASHLKKAMQMWGVCAGIFDILTDYRFVMWLGSCNHELDPRLGLLWYASLCCIAIPFLINIVAMGWSIKRSASFAQYFDSNPTIGTLMVLFSCLNPSAILMLNSQLFGSKMLNAKLERTFTDRIKMLGLITNFLEDIPQIIIQILSGLVMGGTFNTVTLIAILSGCSMLLLGIAKRLLLCLTTDVQREKTAETIEEEKENLKRQLLSLEVESMKVKAKSESQGLEDGTAGTTGLLVTSDKKEDAAKGKGKKKRKSSKIVKNKLKSKAQSVVAWGASGDNGNSEDDKKSPTTGKRKSKKTRKSTIKRKSKKPKANDAFEIPV